MTIEMGSLHAPTDPTHPNPPASSGTLFTFDVSEGDCTVTITENAARAGVVMENGSESGLGSPVCTTAVLTCPQSGDPDYTAYGNAGSPHSWCTACQPLGNANGDGYVDGADVPMLIAAFGTACGGGSYNANADFNHDCYVDGADVPFLIANFGTACP